MFGKHHGGADHMLGTKYKFLSFNYFLDGF